MFCWSRGPCRSPIVLPQFDPADAGGYESSWPYSIHMVNVDAAHGSHQRESTHLGIRIGVRDAARDGQQGAALSNDIIEQNNTSGGGGEAINGHRVVVLLHIRSLARPCKGGLGYRKHALHHWQDLPPKAK